MDDYSHEEDIPVDFSALLADAMPEESYVKAHKHLVIVCHDVFIQYSGGILLVKRKKLPAKGSLSPVGGRIYRGLPIIDSLKKKVKQECNLDIDDIRELGCHRTFFASDPFGHGHGTDTVNFIFFAKGRGILRLDEDNLKGIVVTREDYQDIQEKLRPSIRDSMDKAIKFLY